MTVEKAIEKKRVLWFDEITRGDVAVAGGKGANLGEMTRANIPVPWGFVVSSQAYFDFLDKTDLRAVIIGCLKGVQLFDNASLNRCSEQIKEAVLKAKMPRDIEQGIKAAYKKLGEGPVAVRSSATAEDMPDASFAGQQSTFLNVQGADNVVQAVHACWASLFEARAIFYRQENGYDHFSVGIAVPVQKMVQSQSSGVMFTVEPVYNDITKIVIEAVYGLGEAMVSGHVSPDTYTLDKSEMKILRREISKQEWKLVRNPGSGVDHQESNVQLPIPAPDQQKQKLSDAEVVELARIGKMIEEHYNYPQDIEWAKEEGKFFIVQTRPVTTIKDSKTLVPDQKIDAKVLVSGAGASPGIGSGPVKVIFRAAEIDKVLPGDVLVTEMTTPDFVPAMKRASAIVTDRGGRTCHAAIVSRELGVPCVVGSDKATKTLSTGQDVTVDGALGKVYEGIVAIKKAEKTKSKYKKTKTRVYVNLADPDLVDKVSAMHVDGVGLLRAEFIIAHIGEHPRYMLHHGRGQEFTDKLADGITKFAKAFSPRPVVYRTTDFKTNEYRNLKGGYSYEEVEENPMIGYRGASRYVAEPEVFKLETDAIKRVRQNYKNLYVMIPFVRTPAEMSKVKEMLEAEGLSRSQDFKLWMMTEIPSNIVLLDKFIDVGIDGISIGSNDLTQLTLGVDRDNAKYASLFDERDDAVMNSIEKAVTGAKRRGITASICGQAPSVYPEITEKLVKWGITSVSVSPDMIERTREIIGEVEAKLGILPPQNG